MENKIEIQRCSVTQSKPGFELKPALLKTPCSKLQPNIFILIKKIILWAEYPSKPMCSSFRILVHRTFPHFAMNDFLSIIRASQYLSTLAKWSASLRYLDINELTNLSLIKLEIIIYYMSSTYFFLDLQTWGQNIKLLWDNRGNATLHSFIANGQLGFPCWHY